MVLGVGHPIFRLERVSRAHSNPGTSSNRTSPAMRGYASCGCVNTGAEVPKMADHSKPQTAAWPGRGGLQTTKLVITG